MSPLSIYKFKILSVWKTTSGSPFWLGTFVFLKPIAIDKKFSFYSDKAIVQIGLTHRLILSIFVH